MEKTFSLRQTSPQLWTRELGRDIRLQIEASLESTSEGDLLVIDASGVEVFDFSFANELFGKLVHGFAHRYPGRVLLVEHLTVYARENLVCALEALSLVMVERKTGKLNLIGKAHPVDKETFALLKRKRSPVTAQELSDQLKVKVTAMNERLSKLVGQGLVIRAEGVSPAGRTLFQYRLPA